jgi:hypothetical protein
MGSKLKQIRAAIRNCLIDRTAAESRVSTNRADQVWREGLPAIVIYTRSQTDERDQQAPPSYKRTAKVVIDLLLQEASGLPLDDQADDLAEEVESLLFFDPSLGLKNPDGSWLLNDAQQVSSDMVTQDGGETLIAGLRITWEFQYFQDATPGDPGDLAPFKQAHTDFSLDPSETPPA